MKPYYTPERLVVSIIQAQAEDVCHISYDLSQTPGAFVNECVTAIVRMMGEDTPTLPAMVAQYKVLKAANALKSQLQAEAVPGPTNVLMTSTGARKSAALPRMLVREDSSARKK
ncbi:MAG: hypothetical protein LBK76_02950 [Verrucomicrobiales bacterium]|nr:hypothetical protein [Verrucomicrobiales bacterium]